MYFVSLSISFDLTFWSSGTNVSIILHSFFCLSIAMMSGLWELFMIKSVWIAKTHKAFIFSFFSTDLDSNENYFSVHSMSDFLHRCQRTFLPTLACFFLYWFPASTERKLTMRLTLSTISLQSLNKCETFWWSVPTFTEFVFMFLFFYVNCIYDLSAVKLWLQYCLILLIILGNIVCSIIPRYFYPSSSVSVITKLSPKSIILLRIYFPFFIFNNAHFANPISQSHYHYFHKTWNHWWQTGNLTFFIFSKLIILVSIFWEPVQRATRINQTTNNKGGRESPWNIVHYTFTCPNLFFPENRTIIQLFVLFEAALWPFCCSGNTFYECWWS